jgi:site-specific DNA-methyltransferase (adenine-specific)
MNIVNMKVKDLIPYNKNAKKHDKTQIDNVAESIKQFGFAQPLVVDKNNVLIIGHCRLLAAKKLRMREVPVVKMDELTEEQVKKLRLLDNKLNESEWDFNLLAEDVPSLDFDGFDIDWGIDNISIEEPSIVEDEEPEDVKKRCSFGDVWQLGKHRLMCGDSTNRDSINILMEGKKADVVFTSPPYNGNNSSSDGDVFNNKKSKRLYDNGYSDNLESNDYINFCKKVLDICFEITDGYIFWNVNYNANSRFEYIAQIQDKLEYLIEQIAWIKTSAIPLQGTMRRAWEPIYLFSTNKKSPEYDNIESNKWDISNTNSQISNHKACFPVELAAKGIRLIKPKSGIVFEPFGGSGSTLIACEQLDRSCFTMELDEKYCDVILQRWENFTGQKAVRIDAVNTLRV